MPLRVPREFIRLRNVFFLDLPVVFTSQLLLGMTDTTEVIPTGVGELLQLPRAVKGSFAFPSQVCYSVF